jgi:hypothetical protein
VRRAAVLLVVCLSTPPALDGGAPLAVADDTTVSARVDAARIGEGDTLTLTIEVRGTSPPRIQDPDMSSLADFTIAAGPSISTSTSMVWSGGQASSSTSKQYTYALFPRRKGTVTIPGIAVMVGDRQLRTEPISVEVVEGRIRKAPAGPLRGRLPAVGGPAGEPEGEVLVEAQVDRKEVYVGEQVLLTYKVYSEPDLVDVPGPQKLPSYTGFWVEEIPLDPRSTVRRVPRGGRSYLEITLMKKAIFPTTSGDLAIEETVVGVPVKVRSGDPFESIFFAPVKTLLRRTQPITIHVKPLPEKGRPASFGGAVGRFTLEVKTDRDRTRVNDALGLKIVVRGTGNIRTVGEPVLPPLSDYKRYDPRVDEVKEVTQDRVAGSKSWDYVLTPLAPGRQEIPPVRFAYFDTTRGTYVEIASEPIPVMVDRGEGGAGSPGTDVAGREVTAFGRDVRYIKPVAALVSRGTPYHRSGLFLALLLVPVLADSGLYLLLRRRVRMAAEAGRFRGRRAPGFARRRLKHARRLLAAGKSREFHQEVARALTGYLGDKLNLAPSGLTQQGIEELLAGRGVDEAVRGELRGCLEKCDYARFAPSASGKAEMDATLELAERTIVGLERHLGGRAGKGAAA